jgi:hypothetical protein
MIFKHNHMLSRFTPGFILLLFDNYSTLSNYFYLVSVFGIQAILTSYASRLQIFQIRLVIIMHLTQCLA